MTEPTTRAARVCAPGRRPGTGYCGRTNTRIAASPAEANCVDCAAAIRADEETKQIRRIKR